MDVYQEEIELVIIDHLYKEDRLFTINFILLLLLVRDKRSCAQDVKGSVL